MVWLRQKAALRGAATFLNASDAAVLRFTCEEPHQVEVTLVRNGVVTTFRTTDRESIGKARAFAEAAPFVPVLSDPSEEDFVNVERMTDIVLEPIAAPGQPWQGRKLLLTLKYVPPGNPFQPQAMACGEIHERYTIEAVLARLGFPKHHQELEREEEVVVVVAEGTTPRPRPDASRGAALAVEAERIVKDVRHTHYQHNAVINPKAGTIDCDCSGFVSYVLEVVAPEHLALVPREADQRHPLAFEFFDYLAGQPQGWKRVQSMANVRRGDVLAWRVATIKPGKDTGHVFVAAEAPTFDAAAGAWNVLAIDSAAAPHFDDSRESAGEFHSGVGTGVVRIFANDEGAPVKFQFGPDAKPQATSIVVARLEPLGAKRKARS